MIYVVYALVAVLGAGVHLWRHPADRAPERAVEVALVWWIVVAIGVAGIVGAGFHLFDGPGIAKEIGFTRGDGGFQTEVGFGDLALGVAAVLCIWFRDRYLLAVIVVATISLWGDAYGHIHQEAVNDNHDPDNTGAVLYTDILFPLVAIALYAIRERLAGARRAPRGAAALLVAVLALGVGVWVYDGSRADGATGAWRGLSDAQLERTEVGAARIGNSIYVVGGFLAPSTTTDAVERYDIRHDRWQRARPLPIAVNHPAVAAHGGFLYVYGGFTDSSFQPVTAALQRFDPRSGRWALLPASPTPRAAAALAARGGKLYAAGGADGQALTTLEVYDVETRRWRSAPPMRTPREHIAAAATADGVYVFGGRSSAGELDTVERFDPRSRRWSQLPPLRTARSGFAAVAIRDRPIVFGGEELTPGGTTIPSVELFDPRERRWESLPPMRTPRHGLGGVAMGARIYALEGGPTPGFAFSDAIEFLDVPRGKLR